MPLLDAEDDPFEEQREIYELLSQKTRHLILRNILGHPEHLPSLDELDHMIPKNKAAIADQLDNLEDAGIVREYTHEPNRDSRDLPSKFYGLTPEGVEVLAEHNYLRGAEFAKTVYGNTQKTEKVERHENAPRPNVPKEVTDTLMSNMETESENDSEKLTELTRYIMEENGNKTSMEDQVSVAKLLYEEGITPPEEWATRKDIEKLLEKRDIDIDHRLDTCLKNLLEIEVVERSKPPGPDTYVIGERVDKIINGKVEEYAEKEIESLIDHMDDEIERIQAIELGGESSGGQEIAVADGTGHTIRNVLSQEFGIPAEEIERYLREGNKITRLNGAVQAIKKHDELTKREYYGEILFLSQPYQYRLAERFSV